MSGQPELGRLPSEEIAEPMILDASSKHALAMMTKLDEITDRLNAIAVAIEAATDGNSLFTGLDTAEIKAEIKKLKFFI